MCLERWSLLSWALQILRGLHTQTVLKDQFPDLQLPHVLFPKIDLPENEATFPQSFSHFAEERHTFTHTPNCITGHFLGGKSL